MKNTFLRRNIKSRYSWQELILLNWKIRILWKASHVWSSNLQKMGGRQSNSKRVFLIFFKNFTTNPLGFLHVESWKFKFEQKWILSKIRKNWQFSGFWNYALKLRSILFKHISCMLKKRNFPRKNVQWRIFLILLERRKWKHACRIRQRYHKKSQI